jgi:hypothetical protein
MMDVTGPQRTTFASSNMLGFGWGNPIIARPAREARPLSAGPLTASSVVLSRMRSAIPSSQWDSLHATSVCFHSAGLGAVASTIGPRPRVYAAGAVRPQSAGSCVPRPATSPQCAAHWLIHITSVCSGRIRAPGVEATDGLAPTHVSRPQPNHLPAALAALRSESAADSSGTQTVGAPRHHPPTHKRARARARAPTKPNL